jgi:hypothetical protein
MYHGRAVKVASSPVWARGNSRTDLGRFHDFRISHYNLMMQLIERCRDCLVATLLALRDVQERVDLYTAHKDRFVARLR